MPFSSICSPNHTQIIEPAVNIRMMVVASRKLPKSISAVYNRTAAVEQLIVTKGLDQSQTNGDISGDLVQSLSALSAFFGHLFQSRNCNSQQLYNNAGGDVWGNRKCEQSCVLERAAGQHIQKSQQVSIAKALHHRSVQNGTGSAAPKRKMTMIIKVKQILLFRSGNFRGILRVSNILDHLGLSACLFNLFFGRSGECCNIHGELFAQFAVAQYFNTVKCFFNQAGLDESSSVTTVSLSNFSRSLTFTIANCFAKMLLKPLLGIRLCRGI